MKILYNNRLDEIRNLVESRAKFQKIMLLFDDNVSNLQIAEIYNSVKDLCIFNKSNIKDIDDAELNNGYRMVFFVCEVESFLKFNISTDEVINVFCPLDNVILPYYLNGNFVKNNQESFTIVSNGNIDVNVLTSVSVNSFIYYLKNIISQNKPLVDLSYLSKEITHKNILTCIDDVNDDVVFFDVQILKKYNLQYEKLVLLDLIMIDAFLLFIESVGTKNFSMVDVYKTTKEEYDLIDKFYALFKDDSVKNIILLNYNYLFKYGTLVKEKIINCLTVCDFSQQDVLDIVEIFRDFSKNQNDIFAYLYLFNIFGV